MAMGAKRIGYVLLMTALLVLLAGCGQQQAAPGPEPNARMQDGRMDDAMMMKADEAKRIAEQKRGVDNAYAVVTGPSTIMVGIFLDDDVSDEEASRIEKELAEELPERLDGVQQAMVTSNPDTAERIREIGRGVREGRPLSEFADEIEDLTQRITPQSGSERT